MRHRIWAACLAAGLPVAAQAECLGSGCYDGLALLVGGIIGLAVVVIGLVITLVVLLIKRRFRGAKIVAACLAVIAVGVLIML
ncbi:MAG: hypothetical protein ACRC6I_06775 [Paracoccaceae bacterium]